MTAPTRLARIAVNAAEDATEPTASRLRALVPDLLAQAVAQPPTTAPSLLEGAAGIALAALPQVTEALPSAPNWDAFLLT